MKLFRADLHIHSLLSPCGDLDMSPAHLVAEAVGKGLDMIAVTDHNHTGHSKLVRKLGERMNLYVLYGAEVTTKEEVHCLTFFDTDDQIDQFQQYLERWIPKIENRSSVFGDQVMVDEQEMILETVKYSLYPGIQQSINEVCEMVRGLGGLFVPAHVDRVMNGLYAQMGFFPENLSPDAIEISRNASREMILKEHPELGEYTLIRNSDAHFPGDIGRAFTTYLMKEKSFSELGMALRGEQGRGTVRK